MQVPSSAKDFFFPGNSLESCLDVFVCNRIGLSGICRIFSFLLRNKIDDGRKTVFRLLEAILSHAKLFFVLIAFFFTK